MRPAALARALLAPALLALALAGCLAAPSSLPAEPGAELAPEPAPQAPPPDPEALLTEPPPATPEPGEDAGPSPPGPPGLVLRGCLQGHWNFPARAEDLAPFAPAGFAIAQDSLGMSTVAVTPSWCASSALDGLPGPAVAEVWLEVPVVPPAGAEVEDAAHVVPIAGFVSDPGLEAFYGAWGFPNVRAAALDPGFPAPDGPVWAATLAFEAGSASYRWDLAARTGSGPWDAYRFVRWVPDGEGGVHGRVHLHRGASESAAAGAVAMLHQGDEAPPVAQGVAHMVRGVDMAMVHEAWA